MMLIVVAAVSMLVGMILGVSCCEATIRHLRRRVKELRSGLDRAPTETMKRVVWACVINGFAWVWCSYILAALDKPQIAEELSKVALAEIIAPVVVYAIKSAVENLSKNNHWPDKAATSSDPEEPPGEG